MGGPFIFLGNSMLRINALCSLSDLPLTTCKPMLHHPMLCYFISKFKTILPFKPKVQFMIRLHICVYDEENFKTIPLLNVFQHVLKIIKF